MGTMQPDPYRRPANSAFRDARSKWPDHDVLRGLEKTSNIRVGCRTLCSRYFVAVPDRLLGMQAARCERQPTVPT
jgi:hypothetical protein